MEEDRSELFKSINDFSQRKLKKVQTKVKTGLGDEVIEKRTAKGLTSSTANDQINQNNGPVNQAVNRKLDLQVGEVLKGLMIGSNDVATRKDVLNEYGITHVLNLCPNETDSFQFEDDFNYLAVEIEENVTKLSDVLEECLDFIEEGQKRGSCFVHCSTAKPGLSRSTAICIAYLIYKTKKNYADAFNEVKEARAFIRPSDWFAKQLQVYATEQGAKQQEDQSEDKFTAKKRKEIEEEKAHLQKAVNLQKKKNLWAQKAEESEKQKIRDQEAKEKLTINKLRNNPQAFNNENESINKTNQIVGPRKLTSLVTIFQSKDDEPAKPVNKVVLNTAPAKKWAPVSTPHLQRTVRPEVKNFDFYSKVKKTKSKDFKRADSLKKSKSKLTCDNEKTDMNNNNINQRIESKPQSSIPAPPPPPPPMPIKSAPINNKSVITNKNNQIKQNVPPPPPPPPLPVKKPTTTNPPQQTNKIDLNNNKRVSSPITSINSKTPSPAASLTSSRTSSPQPSSNTSSRVSSPIPNNNTLINNKATTTKLNNGLTNKPTSPSTSSIPSPQLSKLDPNRMNKFNKPCEQTPWLTQKCVDYSGKLNIGQVNGNQKSNETVRNIPIKIEPKAVEKPEIKEEIIELEVEEEDSSENEESESESESEQEESEEEESEEETESEEESESSEESSSSSSSSDDELANEQPKTGGLTRSSTQQILNLIKSKNNETLQGINEEDEDREIDLLLNGLEKEGIENIDWSEFELSLDDIKDIINSNN